MPIIPAGFIEHVSPSSFVQSLGSMYKRDRGDGGSTIALWVAEGHLNLHGVAHGGFTATLIDNALGYNVAQTLGESVVTAHLSIDYLSSAKLGDWVEAEVQISRQGRRICFAECTVRSAGTVIARASCILMPIR